MRGLKFGRKTFSSPSAAQHQETVDISAGQLWEKVQPLQAGEGARCGSWSLFRPGGSICPDQQQTAMCPRCSERKNTFGSDLVWSTSGLVLSSTWGGATATRKAVLVAPLRPCVTPTCELISLLRHPSPPAACCTPSLEFRAVESSAALVCRQPGRRGLSLSPFSQDTQNYSRWSLCRRRLDTGDLIKPLHVFLFSNIRTLYLYPSLISLTFTQQTRVRLSFLSSFFFLILIDSDIQSEAF